jgi:hypothetical protein
VEHIIKTTGGHVDLVVATNPRPVTSTEQVVELLRQVL